MDRRSRVSAVVVFTVAAAAAWLAWPGTAGAYMPLDEVPESALAAPALGPRSAPVYPQLDRGLSEALAGSSLLEDARRLGFEVINGRIQVNVFTDEGSVAGLERWLEDHDAHNILSAWNIVQAWVAPEVLIELDGHPDVHTVQRPQYARPPEPAPEPAPRTSTKAFANEAVQVMQADAWHAAGVNGAGVRVGVIDGGFVHYQNLIGTDLPGGGVVTYQDFSGYGLHPDSGDHGTACAEVIHDMAPGLDALYLVQATDPVQIANAVDWLAQRNVHVISMSQGWLSWGPGDGTGALANKINGWVGIGGVWVNAAGNSALAHWQGTWRDQDGDGYMELANGNEINYVTLDGTNIAVVPADTTISAAMVYSQWSNTSTDLDFLLVYWDGVNDPQVVYRAESDNTASGLPTEDMAFTVEVEGAYGFVVYHYPGTTSPAGLSIEYFNRFDGSPMQETVSDGSLAVPADSSGAIAVAALDVGTLQLESYSSWGPTNGPGGILTGGSIKPDIANYANVSTASYGARGETGGFGGTSCACPNTAGAAALVWSGYPSYTGSQIRTYLESHVEDMGTPGQDNKHGHGRLILGTPPSAGCDPPGVPGNVRTSATSVPSGTSYTISWNAGNNADGYEVQEATNASFNGASTVSVSGTSRAFSHTVNTDTTYHYRARSTRTCGSSSSWSSAVTVTVTAGGGGGDHSYMVAGIASAPGAAGSFWKSYVSVLNLWSTPTDLTLIYRHGGGTVTRTYTLGGFDIKGWDDIASTLFNVGGSSSGAVEIQASQDVLVQARTYNQATSGTFGQYLPGVYQPNYMGAGGQGLLGQLRNTSAFRTNVGFVNAGPGQASVSVTLYGATGDQIGQIVNSSVAAGAWKQINDVFDAANAGTADIAYAIVQVQSGSVWAYGSVVDNASGDPTTIPVVLLAK